MNIEKPLTENQKVNGNKLYRFMMKNDWVTKEQMFNCLGWSAKKDRQLRDLISEIAKRVPVISTSDSKGYKIAKNEQDKELVIHQKLEMLSRIEELRKRINPLDIFIDKYLK